MHTEIDVIIYKKLSYAEKKVARQLNGHTKSLKIVYFGSSESRTRDYFALSTM